MEKTRKIGKDSKETVKHNKATTSLVKGLLRKSNWGIANAMVIACSCLAYFVVF